MILQTSGWHHVALARSPSQFLDILRVGPFSFLVFQSTLSIPDLDGIELHDDLSTLPYCTMFLLESVL